MSAVGWIKLEKYGVHLLCVGWRMESVCVGGGFSSIGWPMFLSAVY